MPTEPTGNLARSFEGSSTSLFEKGNPTSSLNTHVTVLVKALSQLAKFFFSGMLFCAYSGMQIRTVPLTGKKLITCHSSLLHSHAPVSALSNGERARFLTDTSFVFCHPCPHNTMVYVSDKRMPSLWVFILPLKFKRAENKLILSK